MDNNNNQRQFPPRITHCCGMAPTLQMIILGGKFVINFTEYWLECPFCGKKSKRYEGIGFVEEQWNIMMGKK